MKTRTWMVCLLLLGCVVPATGATIVASDNAYVWKASAGADQDESQSLVIKSDGSNTNSRLAYLRFDVSGLAVSATDTVALDLNLAQIGASNAYTLNVWSVKDGLAGETTWDSGLTWANRPDGTAHANGSNANLTALGSHAYVSTGNISVSVPAATLQTLLASDTNDEITLLLSSNSSNSTGTSRLSALGNTGGDLEPTLRVLPGASVVTIPESTYGGTLQEQSESTFSYGQTGSRAKVGEGGSGNNTEYIQMMFFQLPARPAGGFQPGDTSLTITIESEDVENGSEHADLWAIGYVPAAQVGDVGANLNDGGVTDIDDFFFNEADTETKVGWNIGTDNTVKIWDDLAGARSAGTLASPGPANEALTAFINDLYDNHGAVAGDYLVLRNNYDVNMSNYDDWYFYTGSATSNQPTLTLTLADDGREIPEPATMALLSLAACGLGGYVRRRRKA